MTRRNRTLLSGISILTAFIGFAYFAPVLKEYLLPERNLNVLLIVLDAARADRLSVESPRAALAPNIDRLARSGVVFRRAYCYSGSTPPSMAAIFTSKFPYWPLVPPGNGWRWGPKHVYGLTRFFDKGALRPGIPESLDTLPVIFKRHGYTTLGISTNPYLTRDFLFDRGFDFFEELSTHAPYASAEEVTQKLQVYLSELRDEKFFAWVHFMNLHAPLVGYDPFREEAKSKRVAVAPGVVSDWTGFAKEHMEKFAAQALTNWKPTEEGLLKALDEYALAYDAELLRIDKQIGVIVDTLKRNGLWENTLIVILNDHGDEFMEHGDWTHTGQLYEEIVRGVWIMHNPKLFPDSQILDHRVSHVDLMPTLLHLLRFREDTSLFDGISRASLLKKRQVAEDGFLFGVLDQRAYVIDGDHKLIVNNDYGKKDHGGAMHPPRYPVELYDLKNDPGETQNIAEQFPQVVDRLFVKLKHTVLKKGIHFWAPRSQSKEVSRKTLERLKSLGYVQ